MHYYNEKSERYDIAIFQTATCRTVCLWLDTLTSGTTRTVVVYHASVPQYDHLRGGTYQAARTALQKDGFKLITKL